MNALKNILISLRDGFNRTAGSALNRGTKPQKHSEGKNTGTPTQSHPGTVNENRRPDWYESTHGRDS